MTDQATDRDTCCAKPDDNAWGCMFCERNVCANCYYGHVQDKHPDNDTPRITPEQAKEIVGFPIDERWAYDWACHELQEWPDNWDDQQLLYMVSLYVLRQHVWQDTYEMIEKDAATGDALIDVLSLMHAPIPTLLGEDYEPPHYRAHDQSLGEIRWMVDHHRAPQEREAKARRKRQKRVRQLGLFAEVC